jgi:hypothetical protein
MAPLSRGQGLPDYETAPIEYSARTPSNRVSHLQTRLAEGRPGLSERQYVQWVLRELDVPVESQTLVFSRTSLQRDLIHPQRPRALYFSDDVYLGWVPGGLMEVAVTDPELGLVFYKLDFREVSANARMVRDADCLSCHAGSMTRSWPGLLVRSVFPDDRGDPITSAGSFMVGHDTPLEQRWGGWYVTGQHGTARHLGNAIAQRTDAGADIDKEGFANLNSLEALFDPAPYPRPDSDIVALMVLEHQAMLHNRLCEGGLRVRKWSHYQRQLQKELGEELSAEPVGTALRVIRGETERILEALLFCDEIRLPQGGVKGAGAFEEAFGTARLADTRGRSLRDFDLRSRLFRWRCSYMIYSDAFTSLPEELKRSLFARLDEILTAAAPPKRFAHLSSAERTAIREILMATHEEFAASIEARPVAQSE